MAEQNDSQSELLRRLRGIRGNLGKPEQDYEKRMMRNWRDEWRNEKAFSSRETLKKLLLSKEFGTKVVDAIKKTNRAFNLGVMRIGQEFGFIVYSSSPIQISPLFEGEERHIDIGSQSEEYLDQNRDIMGSELVFHTHPRGTGTTEILSGILLDTKSKRFNEIFSDSDLRSFRTRAGEEGLALIYAMGTGHGTMNERAKLLLISFNKFEDFIEFNPQDVYEKSVKYRSIPGKEHTGHIDAYRESGLNVAVLGVNLESTDSPFNPKDVERASTILKRRTPIT